MVNKIDISTYRSILASSTDDEQFAKGLFAGGLQKDHSEKSSQHHLHTEST